MDYIQEQTTKQRKTLKQRIMRRIYVLFMVRNAAPLAFDCLALVIVLFVATVFVSVKDVLTNFSQAQNSGNLSAFSFSAVSDTEIETKILLIFLGIVGFFAVRHLKQAWRAVQTLRSTEKKV